MTAAAHGAVVSLPVLAAMGATGPGRVVVTVAMAAGAVPMAGGKWSPDIDQYKCWKRLDRVVPDEWLGAGGPLRHRGITHWPGLPLAWTLALVWLWQHTPTALAVLAMLVSYVPLAGWWSHLVSDFFVGARYYGGRRAEADDPHAWDRKSMLDADDAPRGPGIPLLGWAGHVGVGWKVGSALEWVYVLGTVALGMGALLLSWRG